MPSGFFIIDKPADWTSHDVVAKCRGILGERRIGHTGTLDPMATGVLPIFVGRATRAIEFVNNGDKTYEATCRFGLVTDTQDSTGTVLSTSSVNITQNQLEDTLTHFRGSILQIPPMYSAVKVNGKKLYELARKGKEVERAPRSTTIHTLELLDFSGDIAILRITCSKGTYIRTLCHDLGQVLGCGAVMASLRRTAACGFDLAQAITMDTLRQVPSPALLLQPIEALFQEYPQVNITQNQEKCVRNGAAFSIPLNDGLYRVFSQSNEFLMLGSVVSGVMSTKKSFYEV